ncbi:CPCC family cysteine-rich protein [Lysinibacillus capsici]|uniref:CPCC family cysteine-rich protein n=1 Tax=Lysinibacillus capsici TaxID=2115968 RepID=UPI002E1D1509|nr:CPCC family cysteine-rich protein [Lysinibacillus capsici]
MEFTCPCCGYKTLKGKPPGTYEICEICFWEDDGVQFYDYDFGGGANTPSLRQAQKNFNIFGACEERCIAFVRKPNEKDEKDSNWKPFFLES